MKMDFRRPQRDSLAPPPAPSTAFASTAGSADFVSELCAFPVPVALPGDGQPLCLYACPSLRARISEAACPNGAKTSERATCGSSVVAV